MTANVNIKRGDLHLAVSTAFNRGRYVLMTGGGDGSPIEITLDLRERPDDLFDAEVPTDVLVFDGVVTKEKAERLARHASPFHRRPENIGEWSPFVTDDHGPSVPAQGRDAVTFASPFVSGPSVYEFALQDINATRGPQPMALSQVSRSDAPDIYAAESADWVHVYDRVTRERRTLKRPEPDATLQGLRDVAADLRGKTYPEKAAEHLQALERGAPVEPPFGCAALPPVGPLTSTEGLRKGDIVRVTYGHGWDGIGPVSSVDDINGVPNIGVVVPGRGDGGFDLKNLSFVGRPDADGWMAWQGGANPVPGAVVEVRLADGHILDGAPSGPFNWGHRYTPPASGDIVAFRIVDSPPAV